MIQRIQTLWWLSSVILLAATLFLPIFEMESGSFIAKDFNPLLVVIGITIVGSVLNIFLFKQRSRQIRIGIALMIAHFTIFSLVGARFHLEHGTQFLPWVALPLISLVFQVLAIRSVRKDEALIKSMDRLR